jgi:anti-sigma B factor antagonist
MDVIETSLCGVPLLRVVGDVDHFTSLALDDAVQDSLSLDGLRLLLDLSECPYLDSGGLGVILTTLRKVRGQGWLGVIGPNRDLSRLFVISGLTADSDFRVFASSQEASAALADNGS